MSVRGIVLPLAGLLAAAFVASGQTEDFYEARLIQGFEAARTKRMPEAIEQFRIAAFGLMDKPVLLTETLVWLALAQEAFASKEAAADTVTRFLEVERRFGGFAKARLEDSVRTAFRNLLARHVPKNAIDSLPSFRSPPASSSERQTLLEKTPVPQAEPDPGALRTPEPGPGALRTPEPGPGALRTPEPDPGALRTPEPGPGALRTPEPDPGASRTAQPDPGVSRTPEPGPGVSRTAQPGPGALRTAEPGPGASRTAAPKTSVPPRFRTKILPEYPPDALKAGAGGTVLLNVLVSETGEALKVEVLGEARPDLAQASVAAVKRWTFEPARKEGVPVRASITVPIVFEAPPRPPTPPAP